MSVRSFFVAVAFAFLAAIPASAQTFVFDLSGSQEVPPNPSIATGGCMGQLDQPARTFTLTCVHNVIGATVTHIHQAPAGSNGPVAFDLGDPASPVVATWTAMTDQNIADLLAGNLYINIHTAGRPEGEIRGQILTRTVDTVPFTANGSQVVPPNETSSTASCSADLNNEATSIAVACTHNVVGATEAHVHNAPFGVNGPTVFTFASPASPLAGNVPVTSLLVANFAARFLYLDIHTPEGDEDNPGDEIRGQIGLPPVAAGTGTIIIEKDTTPAGGSGFSFTETITPGSFVLNDGGARTFTGVAPGTYTVTEDAPPSGYTLGGLSCSDGDSTVNTTTRAATIRVAAGETVTCTFRNFTTVATDQLLVFHLSGDQEVPPVVTPERGGCMGRFNAAANELSLLCTHNVENATVMHIHQAPAGANGDIVFDMGDPTSPVMATWSGMSPADVANLLAGNLYVNIHTAGRPAGAIRGQLLERTVDTITFPLDAAQTVPSGTSSATGTCTADLNAAADGLAVNCTHTIVSPDAAHVHQAPRGENGPIAFTFPSPVSPFAAVMPMTPRLVADFAAWFLYVDVHGPEVSEENDPEQIRGQIAGTVALPVTGTIRIVKATSPGGGSGYSFTEDIPGPTTTFTLDDGGTETFNSVSAGTYTVTENAGAGSSLTDVTCNDVDSTGDPFARTATVRLQAGETVTCTFHNLQSVAAPQPFVFHLSADQEVPATDSTARGGCFGQLDAAARTFALVCTHNVDGPAVAHIHRAPAGAIGPVVFDLGDPASPMEATWTNMTPADVSDLLAGNFYVNIHASGRPDGEIRGQILPRTVDSFFFTADAEQEVPPTDSNATGDCFADLNTPATALLVRCTHTVPVTTMIHVHDAPPGIDGPIVHMFANGPSFQDNVPMTPRLLADFAAGFLYVNVHSPAYETGEIRGQLIPGAAAPAIVSPIPTLNEWAALLLSISLLGVALWRARS